MSQQLPITFPTVTAPSWQDSPLRWACWLLQEHPDIYRKFRELTDDALRLRPGRVLSADQVLHVIRWDTELKGEGDVVKINNNASALFARLYVLERPQHEGCFRVRKSFYDMLSEEEWRHLLLAFEPLRDKSWRFI